MRIVPFLLALAACSREPAAPAAPSGPTAAPPGPAAPSGPAAAQPPHPVYPPAPSWGEPDMPKIEQLFKARFAEVKRCYEAELQRNPEARGKLTLKFTIVESGAIRYASVAKTTFANRRVPTCILEVVRRWKTPFRPAEPVEVEYPFAFSPR